MKKILFSVPLFALLMGVYSCGDNEDFSSAHVLTDAEMAEMHRQDSIDSVNRSKIDADLVLEYTVEDYPSASIWTNQMLQIDLDAIGDCFGLTAAEVQSGINGESGAPDISGFAIQGSTHADYATASTTNGTWGHWFDLNGDAGTWSDLTSLNTIRFYCEWQETQFCIGQYPGNVAAGETYTAIEGLSYQGKRVAVVINVNFVERGEVSATVAGTQEFTVTQNPRTGYDSDAIEFDANKVMSDLGVSSMKDVTVVGVNADGSYNQECTATNGFWYDMDGNPGVYGENSSVYIEYYGLEDGAEESDMNKIYLGQFPSALSAGFSKSFKYGFMANNKIEMFTVNFTCEAYQDPETAPTGTPTTDTALDVTIEKTWDDTYSNVQYDIKEALRNAFKMTTYQIFQAAVNGDLKVYVDEAAEAAPEYTSDNGGGKAGYWLGADGKSCDWANGQVFLCFGSSETELYLYAGNHPSNCVPNTTVTTKYVITCNGGAVTLNVTVKVGDKPAE